jgi:hypothetical protein
MTYGKYNNTTSTPAREFFLITPSASILEPAPKALRADTEGTITFQAVDSPNTVTVNVLPGEILPVQVLKVTAATATVHGLA